MFGVLINVGSNSSNPNGRGRILEDFTFEYLPIPEEEKTIGKVPTYRDLGFAHLKYPDLPVHLDPEFESFTYGHVKRGFGDVQSLSRLGEDRNSVLFFYATLQRGAKWSPYIIGYFKNLKVYDCRRLSKQEIRSLENVFRNNAHLKRVDPIVDFLIHGGQESRLLNKAYLITEDSGPLRLRKSLDEIIYTTSGKEIVPGAPWFRWTLSCSRPEQLIDLINHSV